MAKTMKSRSDKSRSQLTKAEKAVIKQEQAEFVKKINTAVANEHQQAIFAAAQSGQGQYVVLAGPGSGKTFTGIKASTSFTGRSIYFSYNKKIQIDTNDKLVAIDSPMVATTAHAFGLSCLIAFNRGQCNVDDKKEKYAAIVRKHLADHWQLFVQSIQEELQENEDVDVEVLRLDAIAWSLALIHYAQVSLTEPTPDGLSALVDDFDLSDISRASLVWPFVTYTVAVAIDEGQLQFLGPEHLVSFDDMIYLPNVIEGVPVRQYDHIIVDEAQDTSRASLELMLKACHSRSQVFFIGDKKQSIYAFAGAAFDSIDQIIDRLDAETLPLRICYRCGSKIVDLANQLGGELISAGLHQGNVEVIVDYLDRLRSGDAVLGRTTKKLVQGCLRVLQMGRKAKVLGKNIGDNIAAVVTKLEAKRLRRGVPALQADLSNFLEILDDHKRTESKSLEEGRKNPELALSELEDKIETVRAFFEAYIGKCYDESLRVEDDPRCAFNKTAKDFKLYIHGLFSEDDSAQDFILFMTAHRSKGGEWKNVYIIGTDEFPHPKAKSDRQKQQEENLMYVAVTRAMENLYFVGAPFSCLNVPGYESSQQGLTIISFPAADHLEIHPCDSERVSLLDSETVLPQSVKIVEESTENGVKALEDRESVSPFNGNTVIDASFVEPMESLVEGRVSRIAAIEVLCPACGSPCVDRALESQMITYDLVGHSVICSACGKACIVPLNAFSLQGNVVAREKPAGVTNSKVEKKGRTKKEKKSKAGRKSKSGVVREPMQLSLDVRTIQALNAMGVNKSQLFEELLLQYEPFLDAWAELGNESYEEDDDDE